jgi:6,7-dimethyl-8-ribityllumazine synthase
MELVGGRRRYDGYVALGCVIRGETSHYDHICMEATRGLNDIAMNFSVAVGNGILTCETREQALARAATNQGNKGAQAARAAIEMVRVKRELMPAR